MSTAAETTACPRHYWLPIANDHDLGGVRHAFRGRRWDGQKNGTTVCGVDVLMYEPTELDWIMYGTCHACNRILKKELLEWSSFRS